MRPLSKVRKSSNPESPSNSTENKAPEEAPPTQQPEKKKKKKKIIKKVKKVKKSKTAQEVNVNASNNIQPLKYELASFIARTGGTGALPHFCVRGH